MSRKAVFKIALSEILKLKEVKLDLGCGPKKKKEFIGIDIIDLPEVDIVGDILEVLKEFPSNSVDYIWAKSILEHVNNLMELLREISRVLKPSGKIDIFVPHFANPYYYSDPTHVKFFGIQTFQYISSNNLYPRKVPKWYAQYSFYVEKQEYFFYSYFRPIRIIKKIIGKIINSSPIMQLFYEENLIYLIPPYGLWITLRKIK